MTLIVADTAPLRYLVQVGYEDLLPQLFVKVWIPGAVVRELRRSERLPSFAIGPSNSLLGLKFGKSRALLRSTNWRLDRGEWEAIQLAKELRANLLLMDERFGVRLARQQGFTVIGTLGVLVEAARLGPRFYRRGAGPPRKNEFSRDTRPVRPNAGSGSQVRKGRLLASE